MGVRNIWLERLGILPSKEWGPVLAANSGLPGPRANLELMAAFAELAPPELAERYSASSDEFEAAAGTLALGRVYAEGTPEVAAVLLQRAADQRWRVREAVAMALQAIGDSSIDLMTDLVNQWRDEPSLLVQRARTAGMCEPRLLGTSSMAAKAITVCDQATAALIAHRTDRKEDRRVLRKALGYCWSVAVAADPAPGLAAFEALDTSDPDVAWLMRENMRKTRMIQAYQRR